MFDDFSNIKIWIFDYGLGNGYFWGCCNTQPLAVEIDAVFDDFMIAQWQAESETNDIHAKGDIMVGCEL